MRQGKKRAVTGFGVFLLLTLLFAIFFYFNFKTIQVDGTSMYPTLKNGQKVLVSKAYWLIGPIRDKDIVVIKDPGGPGDIIKRVYRMAGESVDWAHKPDGVALFQKNSDPPVFAKYIVPEGYVYVLGDNRPVSEDSHRFGPVDMKQIIGKVVVRR